MVFVFLTNMLDFTVYLKDEAEGRRVGNEGSRRHWVLKSLFLAGLMCQYFAFDPAPAPGNTALSDDCVCDVVFQLEHYFCSRSTDISRRLKALTGLGRIFLRYPSYMLRPEIQALFSAIFRTGTPDLKQQLLSNIQMYLTSEEQRLVAAEAARANAAQRAPAEENLAAIGGEDSGFVGVGDIATSS
jgi:hypothetical protein